MASSCLRNRRLGGNDGDAVGSGYKGDIIVAVLSVVD